MQKIPYSEAAFDRLRPALIGAKGTIKKEVKQGISHLYKTGDLLLVIRPEGKQLVLVAVAGKGLIKSRQNIMHFATKQGFQSIRFHTKYPEHLQHAMQGLPIKLVDRKRAILGRDELIFTLEL